MQYILNYQFTQIWFQYKKNVFWFSDYESNLIMQTLDILALALWQYHDIFRDFIFNFRALEMPIESNSSKSWSLPSIQTNPDQAEPIESSNYEFESSKMSRDELRKSVLLNIFIGSKFWTYYSDSLSFMQYSAPCRLRFNWMDDTGIKRLTTWVCALFAAHGLWMYDD